MNLNSLQQAVVIIAAVGIMATVAALVLANFQQSPQVTNYVWDSYTENITLILNTNVSLTYTGVNPNTFHLYNASDLTQEVPTTSYTLYADEGKVYLTDSAWNNTLVTADYEYNYHNEPTTAYNVLTNSLQGTQNLTSQLPLIGTIIALIILASLAFNFFMKRPPGTA